MLIVMDAHATAEQIARVCDEIRQMGYQPHPMPGPTRTAIGVTGNEGAIVQTSRISSLPGVIDIVRITKPYKLVSREFKEADTIVRVGDLPIGGPGVVVMAGPCTVESRDQLFASARAVLAHGATVIRGGAYKPRSSPYSFQGLGEAGLRLLAELRQELGVPVVTEVLDTETLPLVEEYADILQIGARNMQNYSLLRAVGRSHRPVLLKRGFAATLQDLLLAAEYILVEGNRQVILCERGVRSFDQHSRFMLDLGAIPVLKALTHLPVIVDPSHAAGQADRVIPMARAAVAAGADGLIVEVHPDPAFAVCDGEQALVPHRFAEMMQQIERIAAALGRPVLGRSPQPTHPA
ncbi:3-deoxy-7-phosphoheptulonate synthase [Kallotenue papyrolyticum]|uniref:3-deoxy-7-phosphoheptulonate synthase n=1 Tax=Kallotenue papyrolyticum TaxID=1325125 RepID=UPI0004785A51|nr:3-deoxy-7-phosphoheptulonate synthase [Kallotenue papyrolyticum]